MSDIVHKVTKVPEPGKLPDRYELACGAETEGGFQGHDEWAKVTCADCWAASPTALRAAASPPEPLPWEPAPAEQMAPLRDLAAEKARQPFERVPDDRLDAMIRGTAGMATLCVVGAVLSELRERQREDRERILRLEARAYGPRGDFSAEELERRAGRTGSVAP